MMVKALTSFSLGGGRDVHPGDVFEMSDVAAKQRVRKGWVEPAAAPEAERDEDKKRPEPAQRGTEHPEASGTEHVLTRDPQPSHRDPPPPAAGPKGKKGKD